MAKAIKISAMVGEYNYLFFLLKGENHNKNKDFCDIIKKHFVCKDLHDHIQLQTPIPLLTKKQHEENKIERAYFVI